MTDSRYAFFGFLEEDVNLLNVFAWSSYAMADCDAKRESKRFLLENAGIWAECVSRRAPLIVNDYNENQPGKKGLPDGHVQLSRLISVPIILDKRIVAVEAAANKPSDYTQDDVRHIEAFVSNVVTILRRKEAEDRIRASLIEKEVLLQEIHHRAKNNLTVISSMLSLQERHAAKNAPTDAFREVQNRIRSMALAYELLYQSKNLADIDVNQYVGAVVDHLIATLPAVGIPIAVTKTIDEVSFNIDTAIPVGFILTELVSNCVKHAFPDCGAGTIQVALLSVNATCYELMVADNGVGLPEGVDTKKGDHPGFDLVNIFVEQLRGRLEITSEQGTEVRIRFEEIRKR